MTGIGMGRILQLTREEGTWKGQLRSWFFQRRMRANAWISQHIRRRVVTAACWGLDRRVPIHAVVLLPDRVLSHLFTDALDYADDSDWDISMMQRPADGRPVSKLALELWDVAPCRLDCEAVRAERERDRAALESLVKVCFAATEIVEEERG